MYIYARTQDTFFHSNASPGYLFAHLLAPLCLLDSLDSGFPKLYNIGIDSEVSCGAFYVRSKPEFKMNNSQLTNGVTFVTLPPRVTSE